MRKLNATLLSGDNKEEAILKIKDESFAITTDEQLIKIPYSNVKSYNYDEQKEVLSIVKFGGNPIDLNIVKDKQLLELLNNIVKQNKNNSNESMSNYEDTSKKETKKEENTRLTNNYDKKVEEKQTIENKKKSSNLDGVIGLIVVIVIIGIVVFGIKSLFFNEPEGLKGDILGEYYIAQTSYTIKVTPNNIVDPSDETRVLYEIKDIQNKSENYNFNIYDNGVKKMVCTSTFGSIYCTYTNGETLVFTKK